MFSEYCSISALSYSFEFVVVVVMSGIPSDYLVSTQLQLWLFCCWGCVCCWAVTILSTTCEYDEQCQINVTINLLIIQMYLFLASSLSNFLYCRASYSTPTRNLCWSEYIAIRWKEKTFSMNVWLNLSTLRTSSESSERRLWPK